MEKIIVSGYEVLLKFDEDDQIWVASALAFPGCMTHGTTQSTAADEMKIAIKLQLAVFTELKKEAPKAIAIYA